MTVPSKDRGDLIREHGERIATLDERIQNLQRHVDEDIRRDIDRISKILETRKDRQWSLSLGLIMALVGLISAILGGILTKVFEVWFLKVVR